MSNDGSLLSANRGLPLPLGAGSARPNPKKGAPDRKSFTHRVCSAQRGIETMVSEGTRPWVRGRSKKFSCESQRVPRGHFYCWP